MTETDPHLLIPLLTLAGVGVLLLGVWLGGRRRTSRADKKKQMTYSRSLNQKLKKVKPP